MERGASACRSGVILGRAQSFSWCYQRQRGSTRSLTRSKTDNSRMVRKTELENSPPIAGLTEQNNMVNAACGPPAVSFDVFDGWKQPFKPWPARAYGHASHLRRSTGFLDTAHEPLGVRIQIRGTRP